MEDPTIAGTIVAVVATTVVLISVGAVEDAVGAEAMDVAGDEDGVEGTMSLTIKTPEARGKLYFFFCELRSEYTFILR